MAIDGGGYENAAQASAVATALSVSIIRAAGAALAGAAKARRTQLAAAASYARLEAMLLDADVGPRAAGRNALAGSMGTARINEQALGSSLRKLDHADLPPAVKLLPRAFCFSSADVQTLRQRIEHGHVGPQVGLAALLASSSHRCQGISRSSRLVPASVQPPCVPVAVWCRSMCTRRHTGH